MYLGIIIALSILCFISLRRTNKYLIYGTISVLVLVDGFRDQTESDWLNYLAFFNSVNKDATEYFEIGYVLFNNAIGFATDNYNVLLLIHAFLVYTFIYITLFNKTKTPITILALYGLLLPLLGSNRQLLALIFITFSYMSLHRDERYKPYLLIIIAALFHRSAILVIPVTLMYGKKWSSLIIFYISCLVLTGIIYTYDLLSLANFLLSLNLGRYIDYIGSGSSEINFLLGLSRKLFMFGIPAIFYINNIEKISMKDKNLINFTFNLMLISIVMHMVSAVGIVSINYRLDIYFGILGFAVCIGTLYGYIRSNYQRSILIMHVTVVSLLQYFLNPYRDLYEPYISIFENSTRYLY